MSSEIKAIKDLGPSTFDFFEPLMKQGEEGKEDEVCEEESAGREETSLSKKRRLLELAGNKAQQLSPEDIKAVGQALAL